MKQPEPDIRPGQSTELLKELHILTRDGKMNQDSRRKLKQVYHLYQFIEKLLQEVPPTEAGPTLADHGAGKSYLGFILYDLYFKPLGKGRIWGIETRAELVERSRALALKLGFDRMSFLNIAAADAAGLGELHAALVVVLPQVIERWPRIRRTVERATLSGSRMDRLPPGGRGDA